MKSVIALTMLGVAAFSQQAVAASKIMASAPIGPESTFGSASMSCSVYNAGSSPIVLNIRSILIPAGTAQALSADSCGLTPLSPKHSCQFSITGNLGGEFVCRIKATGTTVNIRGIAAFRPSGAAVLVSTPIQ